MVALPTQSPQLVESQLPQSRVTGGDIAQAGNAIAGGLGKLSSGLEQLAVPVAEQEGRDDAAKTVVTRGPDGVPTMDTPPSAFILGPAGDAYRQAADTGTGAKLRTNVDMALTDMRAAHQGDPSGFMTATDAFVKNFQAANPGAVGQAVGQYASNIAVQHRDDMINTNVRNDTEASLQATHDRIKLLQDSMDGLAAKDGGVNSPQFDALQDERQDLQDRLVSNPLSRYNEQLRNADDDIFSRRVSLSGYIGAARDKFQASGNLSEATQWFEKAAGNLGLSEKELLSAEGEIRSHLWGMDAVRRQENEEVKNRADGLIFESKSGGRVDATRFEDTARDLDQRRLYGKAADVRAQARFQDAAPALLGRDGPTAVAALQGVRAFVDGSLRSQSQAVNTAIPPEGRALLDTIAGPESGGRYNSRYPGGTFNNGYVDHPRISAPIESGPDAGKTSTAAGRYQFISTTWDDQARKLGLTNFSPANQDAAAWNLAQETYKGTTGRDLLGDLRSGNPGLVSGAAEVLRGQWSSLPGGRQPGTTTSRFVSTYSANLGRYGGAGAAPADTFAIGDSLADGAKAAGGFQGVTRVGAQPGEILANIQQLDPAQVRGKTILLSGGSSNDPVNGPGIVALQVAALKAKGVDPSSIRIVGVGDRDDFQANDVNPKLQAVARQTGAQFVPLDPRGLGPDRVHLTNYNDLAGPKGQAASIASGTADAAPAFRTLLKETQDTFDTHAERTWTGVKYALGQGYAPTPQETADLKAMAPYVTKPELRAEMQDGLTKLQASAATKGLTLGQQQDLATTMQTLAAGGQLDNVGRHIAANMQGEVEHRLTLAKDQPVLYGQRYIGAKAGASLPPIAPLDLSSPQTFAAGLQARQTTKGAAQQGDALVGNNILTPSDQDTITAALQRGDPRQAATILSGLQATLKPEELAAAVTQKGGLKDDIVGMARSTDPTKMNAAFGFLDAQERANPRLFAAQFKEVSPDLTRWQNLLRWMQPDEVPKAMQKYNDPTQRASLQASEEAANALLKDVTPATVTSKFNTWGGFMAGNNPVPPAPIEGNAPADLLADYKSAFREEYAKSSDAKIADTQAVKDIGVKYGVSPLNGFQVMARSPETVINPKTSQPFTPEIDGSHDWMQRQLDAAIKDHFNAVATDKAPGSEGAYVHQQMALDVKMRADATTEAEIASGRPPSYLVGIQSAQDGMWHALKDGSGFQRFRFDPDAAQHAANDEAAAARDRMFGTLHDAARADAAGMQ